MAHYPVEYMAAILTSVKDDKDAKPFYLYACRGMDIEVLPPDVNESEMDFTPAPARGASQVRRDAGPAIRYGLSAVRNVGEGAVQQIIEARGTEGRLHLLLRLLPQGGARRAARSACWSR